MTQEQENQLLALLGAITSKSIDLGKVAFRPRGAYSSATDYESLDVVKNGNSTYLSLSDHNQGNPLTDTTKWMCLLDGEGAVAAASNANGKAVLANAAAGLANEKASLANAAAALADEKASLADGKAALADSMAQLAMNRIIEINSLLGTINAQVYPTPVRMEVSHLESISTANKVAQKVAVRLYPSFSPQHAVMFNHVSGDSVVVDPSGNVIMTGRTGDTVVWVIPTMNTDIWKSVTVRVRGPRLRVNGSRLRFGNNGKLRIV